MVLQRGRLVRVRLLDNLKEGISKRDWTVGEKKFEWQSYVPQPNSRTSQYWPRSLKDIDFLPKPDPYHFD